MWQQWINGVLGLWIIAVPFLGLASNTLMWTLAVTGIVVAALSFWSAAQTSESMTEARPSEMRRQGEMRRQS